MFQDDFVWGVASSAYQVEGTDQDDGAGKCVWDTFTEEGHIFEKQNAYETCDNMHRYPSDFALMRLMGVKAYRFSFNWARILPNGIGEVNPKGIELYRAMILEMKKNGIEPYITMFHWEYPQALEDQGGWLNPNSPDWFAEYAKVVAENFSDICTNFITINEPQCVVFLGHMKGIHAPGKTVSIAESFQLTHNLLKAHGKATIALRKYAKQPIKIGYAPTGGVAYPETDSPEDIAAAKSVYFGCPEDVNSWAWNVSWFSDPVFFGKYPEDGLKKYAEYLPEITKEDMELIHQPLDFYGQNIYNGYMIRAGKDGKPEYVERSYGAPKTAIGWPVTPKAFYWGIRFLTERYPAPLYITENGMSAHDNVAADGRVHDADRITFLDQYIGEMQKAHDDGANIAGYFTWTFLDNFEWADGFKERFGLVYVDYTTQQRIAKDSCYWYKRVMETNGAILSVNKPVPKLQLCGKDELTSLWAECTTKNHISVETETDLKVEQKMALCVTKGDTVIDSYLLENGDCAIFPADYGMTHMIGSFEADIYTDN